MPEALGLDIPVPAPGVGGGRSGPFPWETKIGAKDHSGKPGLEFILDSKSKAGSRATTIKRRYLEVDRLANIVTQIRRVPDEVVAKMKLDSATEWWGVWVTYLGDLSEEERAKLDEVTAQRRASRGANRAAQDSTGAPQPAVPAPDAAKALAGAARKS